MINYELIITNYELRVSLINSICIKKEKTQKRLTRYETTSFLIKKIIRNS